MSTDATTLLLRRRGLRGALLEERIGALRRLSRRPTVQANVALWTIVICSALIVLTAAARPTFLSATTRAHYFPAWMAGPLGGLAPGLANSSSLKSFFSAAIVLTFGCYLVAFTRATYLRPRNVLIAILAVHAIFLLAPPLALTDVFNYFNYARMEVVHHLNPYTTIPALEPHNDPSFALSNWHGLLSPYGPLFTILTFALAPLSLGAFFWSFKVLLLVADLGVVFLVWKCATLLQRQPLAIRFGRPSVTSEASAPKSIGPLAAVILVAFNPIVLVWGLGGDHNDFLTIFFLLLGFYLLLRARAAGLPGAQALGGLVRRGHRWLATETALDAAAGVSLVVATGLKASAGIVIPIVLASLLRNRRRLLAVLGGMALAAVLAGIASVLAFGLHFPDLSLQGSVVTDLSIPNLLGLALGQGGETHMLHTLLNVALVGTVVACCVWAWRREEPLAASGWAMVALLVTLGWVLPWYVIWVLPLAALAGSRRLRIAALSIAVYLVLAWIPVTGEVLNALHLHPGKTAVGRANHRTIQSLLY